MFLQHRNEYSVLAGTSRTPPEGQGEDDIIEAVVKISVPKRETLKKRKEGGVIIVECLPDDRDEEDDVEEEDGGGRCRVSAHPDPLDPPGPVRGVTWEVCDHVSPPPLTGLLLVTEPRYVCVHYCPLYSFSLIINLTLFSSK